MDCGKSCFAIRSKELDFNSSNNKNIKWLIGKIQPSY